MQNKQLVAFVSVLDQSRTELCTNQKRVPCHSVRLQTLQSYIHSHEQATVHKNYSSFGTFDVTGSSNYTVVYDSTRSSQETYLITINYYSYFWELYAVNDASSETIIGCTKSSLRLLWHP